MCVLVYTVGNDRTKGWFNLNDRREKMGRTTGPYD